MKTNSTIVGKLLIALFLTIFSFSTIKAQNSPTYVFKNPVLISGTNLAVGAQYRFSNVKTGVDAIVKIQSFNGGVTLNAIDETWTGYDEAFQPFINSLANTDGYVEFDITFVTSGTSSALNQTEVAVTALDIDGNDDLTIFEHDQIKLNGGYLNYSLNGGELSVLPLSGNWYKGINSTGTGYPGIDTTAKQVMFTAVNTNISNFKYRVGAKNIGTSSEVRYKSAYFKKFIYPNSVLPLNYLSFDAVVNNNTVVLKWITAQEINNSHFEVERSFDMNSYSTAGLVLDGFTVNGSGKSYQFKDNSAQLNGRSMVYYRLKQFDVNGKATYSKVLAVRLQAKTDVTMQVSPNPFVENVTVRFNSNESGNAQIRIINLAGQTLLSKQSTISKGYNNIKVEGLNGLATGMYLAQLTLNGTVIGNQKLIKN